MRESDWFTESRSIIDLSISNKSKIRRGRSRWKRIFRMEMSKNDPILRGRCSA